MMHIQGYKPLKQPDIILTPCILLLMMLAACSPNTSKDGSGENINAERMQLQSSQSILSTSQLFSLIPPPPEGFRLNNTQLFMDTATGDSIANASLQMVNDAGAELYITVSDYFFAREFYSLATGLWNKELAFEKDGSFARELRLPEGQSGWESFDRASSQGTMLIGVKGRYLVSVRSEKLGDLELARTWISSGWMDKLP